MEKLGNCVDHICQEDQLDQQIGREMQRHSVDTTDNDTLKDQEHVIEKTVKIKESDSPTLEQALEENRDGKPAVEGIDPDCPSEEELLSKVNYVSTEKPSEAEISQGLDIVNADGNSMDSRG